MPPGLLATTGRTAPTSGRPRGPASPRAGVAPSPTTDVDPADAVGADRRRCAVRSGTMTVRPSRPTDGPSPATIPTTCERDGPFGAGLDVTSEPTARASSAASRSVMTTSKASGPWRATPDVSGNSRTLASSTGSMPSTVTGTGSTFGSSMSAARYVRRSRAGAATTTPERCRSPRRSPPTGPASPNATTRRSARPTTSRTVRSIDASIPASVASDANRTPTPRAIPMIDSPVRPRRAPRLRQASDVRPPTG